MPHKQTPTPKSGAEAETTPKRNALLRGLASLSISHRHFGCFYSDAQNAFAESDAAFDRQSAELAQTKEDCVRWHGKHEELVTLLAETVKTALKAEAELAQAREQIEDLRKRMEFWRDHCEMREIWLKEREQELIALRAERGQAEVGGTEEEEGC